MFSDTKMVIGSLGAKKSMKKINNAAAQYWALTHQGHNLLCYRLAKHLSFIDCNV